MERIDFETELERIHVAAYGWALSNCDGNRLAAEDVLQTSYLKVLDGRATFRGRSSFKTWLFSVIRRTAAEERRKQALWRFVPLGRLQEHASRSDPETAVIRSELSARLLESLRSLPRRQRDVLHLVFYQDFTIAEAARALGVSIGTARTHYERGKKGLRALLSEEEFR